MNWLKLLFSSNLVSTLEDLSRVRAALKKWGTTAVLLAVILLVALGRVDADPVTQSRTYDLSLKALFGLARGVLGVLGFGIGGFAGYLLFQAIESSKGGADATLPGPVSDPATSAACLRNRGLLLALCVSVGALVIGLAVSGAR